MRLLKKMLLIAAMFAGLGQIKAQTLSPLGFSYQAVARDANGTLIKNGTVSLEFEIYQGQVAGTPVYTETFTNVSTNNFGLVSLVVGKGNPVFGNISWGDGPHSVLVKLNGAVVDVTEFSSVPYSEVSRKALEMELNDVIDVSTSNLLQGDVLRWDGTAWVSTPISVDDADADPLNELQNLAINGRNLSISNGNTVLISDSVDDADADPLNELQALAINGRNLSISNGNTVLIPDSVDDADADPLNELQALGLTGNILGLSGVPGTVDLSGVSPWVSNGLNIYRGTGNVGIGTSTPDAALDVFGDLEIQANVPSLEGFDNSGNSKFALDADGGIGRLSIRGTNGANSVLATGNSNGGLINVNNTNGDTRFITDILPDGNGSINIFGANGNLNMVLNNFAGSPNAGVIGLRNPLGESRAVFGILPGTDEAGSLSLTGQNGSANVIMNVFGGAPNAGVLGMLDPNSTTKLLQGVGANAVGFYEARGAAGGTIAYIGNLTGRNNNGFIGVYDSLGTPQAGMFVDVNGNGVLFKDVNNFRMEHPTQPGQEIWYAAIEGPEAAAYERGTATLVNGEVFVDFSDHFKLVIDSDKYTLTLTPLDANSEGLAVVEKTARGFKVKELHQGRGDYSFDWEVKGVRKGYENYRVIRSASELKGALPKGRLVDTREFQTSSTNKE